MEWNIGEAAGLVAFFCSMKKIGFDETFERIVDFQKILVAEGIELAWPGELDYTQGDPHRHAQ